MGSSVVTNRIVPILIPINIPANTHRPDWIYNARDLCVVVLRDAVKMQTPFDELQNSRYYFSAGGDIDARNPTIAEPDGNTFLINASPVIPWGQSTVTLKTHINYLDNNLDQRSVVQTHSEVPTLPALSGRQHALIIFATEDQSDVFVIDPEQDWGGHKVLGYNDDPENDFTFNYGAGDVVVGPRSIGYVPVDSGNSLYSQIPSPRPLFKAAFISGQIAYPKPI